MNSILVMRYAARIHMSEGHRFRVTQSKGIVGAVHPLYSFSQVLHRVFL